MQIGLLAAVYWGAATLALTMPRLAGNVSPVWAPTGIALAALVLFGYRLWPGILIGEVVANMTAVPLASAIGMGLGNSLEALAGAYLLLRVARIRPELDRPHDVVALVVLGAVASTLVGATLGVLSLSLGGEVPWAEFGETWRVWWLGDMFGDLVVAPVLLVFLGPRPRTVRPWTALALVVTTAAASAELAFGGPFDNPYIVFPLLIWAAARYLVPGAALTTLVVSGIAVFHTARGTGSFAGDDATASLWRLDTFLAVLALTGLMLGAYAASRRRAEEGLAATARSLESSVAARTAELAADHRRLNEAQAIAHLGSWDWDVVHDRITWSDELYRIYGLDRATFAATYQGYIGQIHPDDRERVAATVTHAMQSLEPYVLQYRVVHPDGTIRWVHSRGAVLADDGGEPVRLRGTCQDVTTMVDVQAARDASEYRYRTIVEAAQEGVWTFDQHAVTTFVNARMAAMLGYEPEEIVGRSLLDFVPEAGRLVAERSLQRRRQGVSEQYEASFLHRDGTVMWGLVSAAPLPDAEGHPTGSIAMVADITDRKRLEVELAHQARHDALTSLPNRVLLSDRIAAALARPRPANSRVAVLFIDIDRFKWVNDSLGHDVGDRVLQEISRRLADVVRPDDTVARLGGDEFVVLCERVHDLGEATSIAGRLLDAFSAPFVVDGRTVRLAASIGVAFGTTGDDPGQLISDADSAMYQAKAQGRGRVEVFDEATRREVMERFEVASGLRRALEAGEFVVHYQPVVDLATGRVVGVEALVRWRHPDRGLLYPNEFIGVAEESGVIRAIGAQVLEEACAQVARWNATRADVAPLTLAVNLSAVQLSSSELQATIERTLDATGLEPELLHLEITESVLMADAQASVDGLQAVHDLGVRLLVDDFGTGYSSLLYLRRFPVDILKVDRSFVQGLLTSSEDAAIVGAVIGLARSLNLAVVAEGVETAAQATELRRLGCDLAQGYLWTEPLAAVECEAWLDDSRARSPATHPVRVLVVDDFEPFRAALRLALELDGPFSVVAEAGSGSEAVERARSCHPDLVLLDLEMPGLAGRDALPLIHDAAPGAAIVIVTGHGGDDEPTYLAAGAAGYLDKAMGPLGVVSEVSALLAHA